MNVVLNFMTKVRRSLKGRGIVSSVILIPKRYIQRYKFRSFDLWGLVETQEMDGAEEVKKHATKYEASNLIFFKKMFQNLDWPFQNSTYIDFGCGKGASLVYAADMGFKKVIGVEFATKLARIASENMNKYAKLKDKKVSFEVFNIDASQFEIPLDADCFYFFNPFDAVILDLVLRNIVKSLDIRQRKILIVYLHAVHVDVIRKYNFNQIRYISPKELDIYYFGGGYVFTNN